MKNFHVFNLRHLESKRVFNAKKIKRSVLWQIKKYLKEKGINLCKEKNSYNKNKVKKMIFMLPLFASNTLTLITGIKADLNFQNISKEKLLLLGIILPKGYYTNQTNAIASIGNPSFGSLSLVRTNLLNHTKELNYTGLQVLKKRLLILSRYFQTCKLEYN